MTLHIHRCACGGKSEVAKAFTGARFIQCSRINKGMVCWKGPHRRTEKGAIEAWNSIMSQHKGKRSQL